MTVLNQYAFELKGAATRNFTVTPAWRTELRRRLTAAGVTIDAEVRAGGDDDARSRARSARGAPAPRRRGREAARPGRRPSAGAGRELLASSAARRTQLFVGGAARRPQRPKSAVARSDEPAIGSPTAMTGDHAARAARSAHGALLHARSDARLPARAVVRRATATASSRGASSSSSSPLDDGTRLIVAPEALSRFYLDPVAERRGAGGAARRRDVDDARGPRGRDRGLRRRTSSTSPRRCAASSRRRGPAHRRAGILAGHGHGVPLAGASDLRADQLVLWVGGIPPELDLAAWADAAARRALTARGGRERRDGARPTPWSREGERLSAAGVAFTLLRYAGGHRIDADALTRLAEGFEGH